MSAAAPQTASLMARVKGAAPRGVGSRPSTRWCMIGLPTTTTSWTWSGSADAARQSPAASSFRAVRTAPVSSAVPPGLTMA